MHVLIDGDWILYAAGFAGQKTKYVQPGSMGPQEFANITEMRAEAEYDDELPVYSRIVLDPPSHIFHSAKNMIDTQLQKISDRFNIETVTYTILMDGDGNFRNRLATIAPYKGNRAVNAKPQFYNELRQYLLDTQHAEVVHGHETDDEMAIRQMARVKASGLNSSIIVAVDKDMLQVPGWHRNPNKGFKMVTPLQGLWTVHVQCLTGDPVDNIKGAYKVGPKRAEQVVPKKANAAELWDSVVREYERSMDRYPSAYPEGMTPEEVAVENMRLVWLRREPGEIWMPPS